jgi:hypothetical protein
MACGASVIPASLYVAITGELETPIARYDRLAVRIASIWGMAAAAFITAGAWHELKRGRNHTRAPSDRRG